MKKVFLDANIFISFLDETRKNHKNANELLKQLYDDENTIMIFSNDILTNIVYSSKGLRKEAVSMIKNINKNPAFYIANFTNNTIDIACEYYLSVGNFSSNGEFEDALQYFCALENGCDKIYTDDTSNFPKLKLPLFCSDNKPFYAPD